MAVGVFPAFKLGVLFVKQISKPLAKFLVSQAKAHPLFRTYVIIPPAQCKCILGSFRDTHNFFYHISCSMFYSLSLGRSESKNVRDESR